MADPHVTDLVALDRDVRRAAGQLAAFRREARADGSNIASLPDPFADLRHVASRSTVALLSELTPSAVDAACRDGLALWIGAFVQARVALPDEVAERMATQAPAGRYEGEPPRLVSFRDAVRGVAAAPTLSEARLWLRAALFASPRVTAARRHRAGRRREIARRMNHAHPWDGLARIPSETVVSLAWKLLDATEELAREATRTMADAAEVIQSAVARQAGDGWPARLTPSWLDEVFAARPRAVSVRLPDLPQALGASSFARALASFGFAFREAAVPSAVPFVLTHEPSHRQAHLFACVFGALATEPDFHVRVLGLGQRRALGQARVLARAMLHEVRARAARVLVCVDSPGDPAPRFEEVTARLFRAPLDRTMAGAFFGDAPDEPGRFVATLQSAALRASLVETFDIDWYRNPRAFTHLMALVADERRDAPSDELESTSLEQGVSSLKRAFEGALA